MYKVRFYCEDCGDFVYLEQEIVDPNATCPTHPEADTRGFVVLKDDKSVHYVNRGDPSAHDFIREDFIADSNWHTLDLSSIIPEGTKVVYLRIQVQSILVNYAICFRKKGDINEYNINVVTNQVAGVQRHEDRFVACDSDRKIEYKVVGSNWDIINLLVKGWFV